MNMWVCQQISVLRERFYNTSHWVRQRIPMLLEAFYDAPHIQQLCLITAMLFTLSLPVYLFVPTSLMSVLELNLMPFGQEPYLVRMYHPESLSIMRDETLAGIWTCLAIEIDL
jgi:hypothetical protein